MLSLIRRNINVTCVIFSTISPTSCRSWSMVIGLPIIDVRQFCSVQRLVSTCTDQNMQMTKAFQALPFRFRRFKHFCLLPKHLFLFNTESNMIGSYLQSIPLIRLQLHEYEFNI